MLSLFLMLISLSLFIMAVLSLPSSTRYREMLFQFSEQRTEPKIDRVSFVPSAVFMTFAVIFMLSVPFLNPIYNVWKAKELGRAELARAEENRQIKIKEADAIRDSAESLAQAERTRAEGIRDANTTISNGLGGPDGYLRWLTIQSMEAVASKEGNTVIYIPTEAGVPVTESLRLKDVK